MLATAAPAGTVLLGLGGLLAARSGALAAVAATTSTAATARRRADAVAGGKLNLEFDDLVPLRIGAIPFRDGEQFAQTTTRIGRRRRGGSGDGLFFCHAMGIDAMPARSVLTYLAGMFWLLLLLGCLLAGDGGLEGGAGGELGHGGGGNLESRAGLGILAGARSALGGLEAAEADKGDGVALRDSLDNGADHGGQNALGGSFADLGFLGDNFNEFGFVHLRLLIKSEKGIGALRIIRPFQVPWVTTITSEQKNAPDDDVERP
jgi:hypothetical protein